MIDNQLIVLLALLAYAFTALGLLYGIYYRLSTLITVSITGLKQGQRMELMAVKPSAVPTPPLAWDTKIHWPSSLRPEKVD